MRTLPMAASIAAFFVAAACAEEPKHPARESCVLCVGDESAFIAAPGIEE